MFKQPNFSRVSDETAATGVNRTCEVAANAGGVNKVLVLDTNRKPLMPCYPARARKLLEKGRASVFRRYPFTIILHDRIVEESELQDIEIKIDQGSKTTGVALVIHGKDSSTVAFAAHIEHRTNIKSLLDSRRAVRRNRRQRKTRYRAPRFLNRTRPEGWLPPSVKSKANNILNWVNRFRKLTPISRYALETARFDTQKLENPEIQGDGYQQGKMYGYSDKRAYLFEREKGCCIYCGRKGKMEVEHVVPKSKGGTDSLNNLVLSCHDCNQAKGNLKLSEFLKSKPSVLRRVRTRLGANYRDAAHTNSIRLYVMRKLNVMAETDGTVLTVGYGYTTSKNRSALGLPKDHWIDAAVCTDSGIAVKVDSRLRPLVIKATGRGSRQFCSMNRYGFPRTKAKPRSKNFFGFKTGDMVRVIIPIGAKTKAPSGSYLGRVVTRSSGHFDIRTRDTKLKAPYRYCKLTHLMDGYSYV